MENGSGCLIILAIIILIAIGNMRTDNTKQTDAMKDEIRQLKTELEYRR